MTGSSLDFDPDNLETISLILEFHDNEDTNFTVLNHNPGDHDPSRPLVLVIHPGDLIEPPGGWGPEYESIKAFSLENQAGTARDIESWLDDGADICILHRGSCSQFGFTPNSYTDDELAATLYASWIKGTAIFGDNLDVASKWIFENLHIETRPHIYLAGAYATPIDGCLTFIGQKLEQVIGADKITVSRHAPAGNCESPCWRPEPTTPNAQSL